MGTRAQFFIGNPEDVETRQWLGCVAWDGYPDGDIGRLLSGCGSPAVFVDGVNAIKASRRDFCDPAKHDFPFPWKDDLFLTDFTYAFIDGRVKVTCFHHGWRDLSQVLGDTEAEHWSDENELPGNVQAPSKTGKPDGPDSIIVLSIR